MHTPKMLYWSVKIKKIKNIFKNPKKSNAFCLQFLCPSTMLWYRVPLHQPFCWCKTSVIVKHPYCDLIGMELNQEQNRIHMGNTSYSWSQKFVGWQLITVHWCGNSSTVAICALSAEKVFFGAQTFFLFFLFVNFSQVAN